MAKETEEVKKEPESPKANRTTINPTTRNILLGAGLIVIILLAFGAGIHANDYRHNRGISSVGFGPYMTRKPGFRGGYGGNTQTQNGIVLSGKVTAVNGNDFTVDQNGSSKTVKTDSNTRFRGVGINGLKSGDQVVVSGTTNSDGSIQALSVGVGAMTTSSTGSSSPDAGAAQSF